MKKYLIFVLFIFNSCQLFFENQLSEEEILKKRLANIDWKKVDIMPTFVHCELLKNKTAQNECFFEFLEQNITYKLKKDTYINKLDSLTLKVKLDNIGNFTFSNYIKNATIDSILDFKLANFPRANPAIKQGIFVKTEFIVCIDLKK